MILNEEQKKVIYAKDHFLFLLAGAGSGKTRVIVEKIKILINSGVTPNEILAITFTNKASMEMKERIKDENVNIHTFHSFAYKILKEDFNYQFLLLENHLEGFNQEEILSITKYKNSLFKTSKPKKYVDYQNKLKEKNIKDFDDLLLDLYTIIKNKHHKYFYKYIFIDEFQDTNILQYELIKKLIKDDSQVFAVGDPNQSIYKFRGASNLIIKTFMKDYQAKIYTLNTNYRSSPNIIYHSNRLIKQNNDHYNNPLTTTNIAIGDIKNIQFYSEKEENFFIINLIKKLKNLKVKSEDIAILYRTNYRAYELKNALYNEGIKHQIHDDVDDPVKDGIQLMTIHKAKGLEFYVVIIIGLEENVLPSYKTYTNLSLMEERRLMYVAMTRAKQFLYLTSIKKSSDSKLCKPSRFILESGVKNLNKKTINDIISLGEFYGHKN